jgi:hypothetical protein
MTHYNVSNARGRTRAAKDPPDIELLICSAELSLEDEDAVDQVSALY